MLVKTTLTLAAQTAMKQLFEKRLKEAGMGQASIPGAGSEHIDHAKRGELIDWSKIDITGVSAVIKAFKKPACDHVQPSSTLATAVSTTTLDSSSLPTASVPLDVPSSTPIQSVTAIINSTPTATTTPLLYQPVQTISPPAQTLLPGLPVAMPTQSTLAHCRRSRL
jgi:hypothetical protein